MMFISGFLIATAIGRYFWLRREREFRGTLIAIYEGWAEPDENGNVGWGRRHAAMGTSRVTD